MLAAAIPSSVQCLFIGSSANNGRDGSEFRVNCVRSVQFK